MQRIHKPMLAGLGLCCLLVLANPGLSQNKENKQLEDFVKQVIKIEIKMAKIAFGPPDIKDLKEIYASNEFEQAKKTWRLMRYDTKSGDLLELQQFKDKDGKFEKVGIREKGITIDNVKSLLKNVK